METSVGDKCGRQGGDKGETSVNPCRPRNTEWETSVGDKCGRQVGDKWGTCGRQGHPEWETSGGDKCKFMRPKEPRVGDQGETSVNSCGPRHPEWKTSVEDKGETSVN